MIISHKLHEDSEQKRQGLLIFATNKLGNAGSFCEKIFFLTLKLYGVEI
jgi:hypothetical protein